MRLRQYEAQFMNSEDTPRSARAKAIGFFLVWFIAGGLLGLMTFLIFLMAAIGGVSTPNSIWLIFWALGTYILPILLALGGLPAAIQIAQGEEHKKTALITLAVSVTSWLVLAGIVFLGPPIFGWSW